MSNDTGNHVGKSRKPIMGKERRNKLIENDLHNYCGDNKQLLFPFIIVIFLNPYINNR